MHNGDALRVSDEPQILSFGEGISLAICFNEAHEREFLSVDGDLLEYERKLSGQSTSANRVTTRLDHEAVAMIKDASDMIKNIGVLEQYMAIFNTLSPSTKLLLVGVMVALLLLVVLIIMVIWSVLI